MIIVGAKGFAKQLIEVFFQNNDTEDLFLFDNISSDVPESLYGFPILKHTEDVLRILQTKNKKFCLGMGNPSSRRKVANQFRQMGADLTSVISRYAFIAANVQSIGKGTTILTAAIVENDAVIGEGVLINSCAAVYHDCVVGAFSELAPGVKILGGAEVGEDCFIGANATILPKVKVGKGAVIGAGAVVINDVPPYTTVLGVPAKSKV